MYRIIISSMLQFVLKTRKTDETNISHTGGRNIFGAVSRLPNHLASLIMDCHIAAAQTGQEKVSATIMSCMNGKTSP